MIVCAQEEVLFISVAPIDLLVFPSSILALIYW